MSVEVAVGKAEVVPVAASGGTTPLVRSGVGGELGKAFGGVWTACAVMVAAIAAPVGRESGARNAEEGARAALSAVGIVSGAA